MSYFNCATCIIPCTNIITTSTTNSINQYPMTIHGINNKNLTFPFTV